LHDPTQRSAVPFCQGLLYALRLGVIPSDLMVPDTSYGAETLRSRNMSNSVDLVAS
jgi:hypothetical protein